MNHRVLGRTGIRVSEIGLCAESYGNKSYRNKLSGIDPERDKLYKYCAASGIAFTVMKSFAGGALLDVKQSPFGVTVAEKMQRVAEIFGC